MLALLSVATSAATRVTAPFHSFHVASEEQVFADILGRSTEDPTCSGLVQRTILVDAPPAGPTSSPHNNFGDAQRSQLAALQLSPTSWPIEQQQPDSQPEYGSSITMLQHTLHNSANTRDEPYDRGDVESYEHISAVEAREVGELRQRRRVPAHRRRVEPQDCSLTCSSSHGGA